MAYSKDRSVSLEIRKINIRIEQTNRTNDVKQNRTEQESSIAVHNIIILLYAVSKIIQQNTRRGKLIKTSLSQLDSL